jgi:hypothetical protein
MVYRHIQLVQLPCYDERIDVPNLDILSVSNVSCHDLLRVSDSDCSWVTILEHDHNINIAKEQYNRLSLHLKRIVRLIYSINIYSHCLIIEFNQRIFTSYHNCSPVLPLPVCFLFFFFPSLRVPSTCPAGWWPWLSHPRVWSTSSWFFYFCFFSLTPFRPIAHTCPTLVLQTLLLPWTH